MFSDDETALLFTGRLSSNVDLTLSTILLFAGRLCVGVGSDADRYLHRALLRHLPGDEVHQQHDGPSATDHWRHLGAVAAAVRARSGDT